MPRNHLAGHRIKSTSRLYLDIRHQAKLTAQSSNCAKGWQWLSCKRAMMTSADIQSIQHGVSCITNPASAACRTLQRFIMNHPRRTVGRQHDIKLNSPNTQGCADAQPGQVLSADASGVCVACADGVLRLQVRGATGERLIKEIRLPAGPSPLARQEERNLGYALLRQWVPTAAARQLASEAARQLAETIRCLPAVLRIPRLEPDGGFSLTTRAPLDLGQRGLVLFFAAWPVAEGGTVDLLQADGYLKPQQVDDHSLRFPGGPRQPGKKYPLGGGYLLVL